MGPVFGKWSKCLLGILAFSFVIFGCFELHFDWILYWDTRIKNCKPAKAEEELDGGFRNVPLAATLLDGYHYKNI
jgi:hypothetical protein